MMLLKNVVLTHTWFNPWPVLYVTLNIRQCLLSLTLLGTSGEMSWNSESWTRYFLHNILCPKYSNKFNNIFYFTVFYYMKTVYQSKAIWNFPTFQIEKYFMLIVFALYCKEVHIFSTSKKVVTWKLVSEISQSGRSRWFQPVLLILAFFHILPGPDCHWQGQVSLIWFLKQ